MKALDLILLIQKQCKMDDEIYIKNYDNGKYPQKDPDITITESDSTEEDENGGWRDIDGELIKGKPFLIW